MAQVSADGTVCLFTNVDVDLVVDVVGYVSAASANKFTPSTPFRFTDTRDLNRPEVHAGQAGQRLAAGQTLIIPMAGVRGIPANATAVSANITVVDAIGSGLRHGMAVRRRSRPHRTSTTSPAPPLPTPPNCRCRQSGAICIYSSTSAHVIIDVNGWWS